MHLRETDYMNSEAKSLKNSRFCNEKLIENVKQDYTMTRLIINGKKGT